MEKEKPLAIHIYRRMLKQATIYRQKLKAEMNKKDKDRDESLVQTYSELSSELWFWVAELEKTPEINPPQV